MTLKDYVKAVHYGRRDGNVKGYMLQSYAVKQSRLIKPYDYVLAKACLKDAHYQAVAVNRELMVTTSFRWIETDYPELVTAVLNSGFTTTWVFFNTSKYLTTKMLWELMLELPVRELTDEELEWIKCLVTIRQSLYYDCKVGGAKGLCVALRATAVNYIEFILRGFSSNITESIINFINENKDLLK